MRPESNSVKSPLQMVGFYLAWVESALGGALWAIKDVNDWPRTMLIVALSAVPLIYAAVVGFVLVFITLKKPHFLFNPSDYSPGVQNLLFQPESTVANPPKAIEH